MWFFLGVASGFNTDLKTNLLSIMTLVGLEKVTHIIQSLYHKLMIFSIATCKASYSDQNVDVLTVFFS